MRFEVPQFIEVEDKIVGPLTWKQFLFLAGGGGMAVVLFFIAPFIVFLLIGAPFAVLAFLLAFYPVNNRPFSVLLESAFTFLTAKKLYHWQKKGTGVYTGVEEEEVGVPLPEQSSAYNPAIGRSNLTSLSRKLELEALKEK